MAGFMYFIDGWVNPVSDETIDQVGLRYAFERRPMFAQINGRTPSGRPGSLLADQARLGEATFAYAGDKQRWEKRPRVQVPDGAFDVYVGQWNDHPPQPADLLRRNPLPGTEVKLAGHNWTIPRLLMYASESGFTLDLPRYVDLDEHGTVVGGETVEEYRPAADLAERVFAVMRNGTTSAAAVELSVEALQLNYVVSMIEAVKLLRLFREDQSLLSIVHAAADWDTFEQLREKKTAEATSAL